MDIVKVDPRRPDPNSLAKAIATVRTGGIIVYPTDTVYGIGADGLRGSAVCRVFNVKRRPDRIPVPLAVSDRKMALEFSHVSDEADALMRSFWPGALTIILDRKERIPDEVTGGGSGVGLRAPDHLVPLTLIKALGTPLVSTSANLHGKPSPLTVDDAIAQLGENVDVYIDSGRSQGGSPSTIIDLTGLVPVIRRRGSISREAIESVIGNTEVQT